MTFRPTKRNREITSLALFPRTCRSDTRPDHSLTVALRGRKCLSRPETYSTQNGGMTCCGRTGTSQLFHLEHLRGSRSEVAPFVGHFAGRGQGNLLTRPEIAVTTGANAVCGRLNHPVTHDSDSGASELKPGRRNSSPMMGRAGAAAR